MILRPKCKIGKRNLYLTENRLGRNEIRCAEDNHSYMPHIMCKRTFILELFNYCQQNNKFSQNCPKFHIFTKIIILKVFWKYLDKLLLPCNFYGRDMLGIYVFIFPSCELF